MYFSGPKAPENPGNSGQVVQQNSTSNTSGSISSTGFLAGSGVSTGSINNTGSSFSGNLKEMIKLSPEEQKEVDKTMKDIDQLFDAIGK